MKKQQKPYQNVPLPLRVMGRVAQCLTLLAFCVLAVLGYLSSALSNVFFVFLAFGLCVLLVSRGFAIGNGNLRLPWRVKGLGLFGSGVRVIFYVLAAGVTYFGSVHNVLGDKAVPYFVYGPAIGFLLMAALSIFPRRFPNWPYLVFCSVMAPVLLGVLIFGLREPRSDVYTVRYPIQASGIVVHGGPSLLTNYHYIHQSQKHSLDVGGKLSSGMMEKGQSLLDDDCFGAALIAVADGKIAKVEKGFPDVEIGSRGDGHPAGNFVLLEFEPERYALYAHMKAGSIQVETGQSVKVGDIIGECGNSGNTSQPHLHFQIQNQLDLFAEDNQTFPVRFVGVTRIRGGKSVSGRDVALRRNDLLIPEGLKN